MNERIIKKMVNKLDEQHKNWCKNEAENMADKIMSLVEREYIQKAPVERDIKLLREALKRSGHNHECPPARHECYICEALEQTKQWESEGE